MVSYMLRIFTYFMVTANYYKYLSDERSWNNAQLVPNFWYSDL